MRRVKSAALSLRIASRPGSRSVLSLLVGAALLILPGAALPHAAYSPAGARPTGGRSAGAPHAAYPHLQLVASSPAAGDTIAASPEALRLEFSQSVDPELAQIRLEGTGVSAELEARAEPDDDRILLATPPPLSRGTYTVRWRVVSDDGHPVSGEFAFFVDVPEAPTESEVGLEGEEAGEAGEPAAAETAAQAAEGETRAEEGESQAAEGEAEGRTAAAAEESPGFLPVLRAVAVGLLMALAGVLLFDAWLLPGSSSRARRLSVILAVAAPLALAWHLVAWLGYIAPPGQSLSLALAGAGLQTTTGWLELLRLITVVLALASVVALGLPGVGTLLALIGVGLGGAMGHAADADFCTISARSVHMIAVAAWIGGLIHLAALGDRDSVGFPSLAKRISRVALGAVFLVAFTGVWQSVTFLPSIGALFDTGYGRMLLFKAGGLLVLIGFGARHRFGLIPKLEQGEGAEAAAPSALRQSVGMELLAMVIVILLAGFLAYLPLPEVAAAATL